MPARSILITGASSGIGADAARTMKKRGWRVFATARKPADLATLKADGLDALYLDYAEEASVHAAIDAALEATGGSLDALYNNGSFGQVGAIEDLSTDALRHQFEVGVFGWHSLTRRVIPPMRRQGHGRIVQCSSVLGIVAARYRGAYVGSKYALEGMTDTLRMELAGTGIHVSLIEPGPIETRFTQSALDGIAATIDVAASQHQADYRRQIEGATASGSRRKVGPEAVTAALIHAVESRRPKIRYRVTTATKFVAIAKRLLPASWMDRLIAANS
jgi:NAD(P)-dependent dehydrogenase (short-subunit alcohol dehydrogenase family)